MKIDILLELLTAALVGATIWALSPFLTGHAEPWDAGPYYLAASLFLAGVLLGSCRPRRVWTHAVGIFLGQLIYALIWLPIGPFMVVGVGFLAIYSLLGWVGAAFGSGLRRRLGIRGRQKM